MITYTLLDPKPWQHYLWELKVMAARTWAVLLLGASPVVVSQDEGKLSLAIKCVGIGPINSLSLIGTLAPLMILVLH